MLSSSFSSSLPQSLKLSIMLNFCVVQSLAHVSSPGPITISFKQSRIPHCLTSSAGSNEFPYRVFSARNGKNLVACNRLKPGVDEQKGKRKTNYSNAGPDRPGKLFQRATFLVQILKNSLNKVLENKLRGAILHGATQMS